MDFHPSALIRYGASHLDWRLALQRENAELRGALARSCQSQEAMQRETASLQRALAACQADLAGARQEAGEWQHKTAELQQFTAALQETVADLKRRLGKDSSNSSKPPSSDGLAKKTRTTASSLRGVSGKKSGGQKGHKGDTLNQTATPDFVQSHTAETCAHCRAALTAAMVTGVEKRQVFDVPVPRLEVTEHQAQVYRCTQCRTVTKAAFPAGVNAAAQYGPRLKGFAVYLNVQHLIPEDRVAEALRDMFDAKHLCPASIVAWGIKTAVAMRPLANHIEVLIKQAAVRHLDETGFRISAKTRWLHSASTLTLTHFRIGASRGDIPKDFAGGVNVHDHFGPYYTVSKVDHALCNAHHLRELKALIDIEKEPWAKKMSWLLLAINRAVDRAKAKKLTSLTAHQLRRFNLHYDAIVARGLAYHLAQPPLRLRAAGARGRLARRPGHNLLIRLRDYKADVLRFMINFEVPFTNNLAEQAIRMMKVKMKISGGFRTEEGAKTFVTLRTVIATARKNGWNILETLTTPARQLILKLSG